MDNNDSFIHNPNTSMKNKIKNPPKRGTRR